MSCRLPLTDHEIWAVALEVEKQHGDLAPVFVAERLGALALDGDAAGIAVWKRVAERLDQLRPATSTPAAS